MTSPLDMSNTTCSICLDNVFGSRDEFMKERVPVAMKFCGHVFHQECCEQAFTKQQENNHNDIHNKAGKICTKCSTCARMADSCRAGRCGGKCPPSSLKLFVGSGVDTVDPFAAVDPQTTRVFDLARLARDLKVDVENLRKMVEVGRVRYFGNPEKEWIDRLTAEVLVDLNHDGFNRIVADVQKEAGWKCLETHLKGVQLAFDHYSASLPLFEILGEYQRKDVKVSQLLAELKHDKERFKLDHIKLELAQTQLDQWGHGHAEVVLGHQRELTDLKVAMEKEVRELTLQLGNEKSKRTTLAQEYIEQGEQLCEKRQKDLDALHSMYRKDMAGKNGRIKELEMEVDAANMGFAAELLRLEDEISKLVLMNDVLSKEKETWQGSRAANTSADSVPLAIPTNDVDPGTSSSANGDPVDGTPGPGTTDEARANIEDSEKVPEMPVSLEDSQKAAALETHRRYIVEEIMYHFYGVPHTT